MLSIDHAFLCLICSAFYLYCSPVIFCFHFNVIFNCAIKVRGLACLKIRFNPQLLFPFKSVLYQVRKVAIVMILFVSVCVLHFNVESFLFSLIFEIRRGTVLVYPTFMYLVLMLYLLFSWCFVCCLVRFCVCCVPVLCRCSPLIFNAFPSVLVCCPDFVFCPWIYEF